MANPNAQLEAALARFAARPGTTPDQQAQLRAAVVADAHHLDMLNQQAAAGQLKDFAVDTPGGASNLAGVYDKTTGVVTVPTASFQPGGTAAGGDIKAVVGLQAIIVDFAHKSWQDITGQTHTVSQQMVANLQSILNGSPVLAAQIKDAVAQGHVRHFSLLGESMAAGATYDGNIPQQDGTPRGINLPPMGLQTNTPASPQGKYDARDMTFVLGHEIQHGFNDAAKDRATRTFMRDISTRAHAQGAVHDYTGELRAYIQAAREDEAKAEIAGWNALLSREQQAVPNPNLDHMLFVTRSDRVRDFVARDPNAITPRAIPKAGLSFNPDNSLSQTSANIAAMGKHYFDRPSHVYAQPTQRSLGLGEHKPAATSDYTNYYGTWALEHIVAAEDRASARYRSARPRIAIDMAAIGLKEDLIEMEGLDLGADKTPRPYLDTSRGQTKQGHFHHTQDASVNPRHDHQYVPVAPSSPAPERRSPADHDHPDHALLQAIREGVRGFAAGRVRGEAGERLSRSLLAATRQAGLVRVDHVLLGQGGRHAFAVQGDLHDPAHARAHVEVARAIGVPVEESDARLEDTNRRAAERLALVRGHELIRGADEPGRAGPALR